MIAKGYFKISSEVVTSTDRKFNHFYKSTSAYLSTFFLIMMDSTVSNHYKGILF